MYSMSQDLEEAILISGVAGIISTWLYAYLQKRISFSWLVLFNLTTALAFLIFIYVELLLGYGQKLVFVLYLLLLPISSIMLLSYWDLSGRIFDLRQSKRIIGSIDSGELIATIIAFLLTPFLIVLLLN